MKEKLVWLCILFFMGKSVFAQKAGGVGDQKWSLNFGGILDKASVVDNIFSGIPYAGINWGAIVSVKYQKEKVSHELECYFSKGDLKMSPDHVNRLSNTYFNFDYNKLYTLGSGGTRSVIIKAGGSLNVLYAGREYTGFINNNSSFEFVASLGGAAEFCYFFDNSLSGLSISDRVNIPLVAAVVQPAFGSDNAAGVLDQSGLSSKDVFDHAHIVSLSSFLRIKNLLSLEKVIGNNQKISFNYTWDYYKISGTRQVNQANNRLGLTYSFIL